MVRLIAALFLLVAVAACPAPRPQVSHPVLPPAYLTWHRVRSPADVPETPPAPGHYRIHLIDVGTGLSILVQGNDFAMLYDAGTNDRDERPERVVAYLEHVLGPSGDDLCGQGSAVPLRTIDHVVLSHPHLDHASALDLVLHCFAARDVWDSGRVNQAVFYRDFVTAVARGGSHYHTAASVPRDHVQGVKGAEIKVDHWDRFSEEDSVPLGKAAHFTILHAEAKTLPDANQNSVVLAVELGKIHLLLVGDSESGERRDPSYPPGDVEEFLLDHHRREIHVDILQVGHHGSKTSSRRQFLEAVAPRLALVSSGPKVYGHTTLPDHEVIEELHRVGATVLRTDEHDASCDAEKRIGPEDGPGGCDSYVIEIGGQ
jgi:competence protein ComEC